MLGQGKTLLWVYVRCIYCFCKQISVGSLSIPANFDYVPVNKTLRFEPSFHPQCVKIVNDALQEK